MWGKGDFVLSALPELEKWSAALGKGCTHPFLGPWPLGADWLTQ